MAQQQQLGNINALAQLGGIQRAITGQQRSEELIRALMATPIFDPRLSLAGAVSGNPTLTQQGTSGLAGIGGILSGVGGFAGGGGVG